MAARSGDGHEIFVVTAPGLEGITRGEVTDLLHLPEDRVETSPGGLTLRGDESDLLRLNAGLRTGSRVLVRVARFRARAFGDLLKQGAGVEWARVLPRETDPSEVRFDVTARKSRLYHTGAIEERLRQALTTSLRGTGTGTVTGWADWALGREPPPSPPRFVVRLLRDEVTLSVDTSGAPLHRRGYRGPAGKAPLRETLAAALLLAAEYDGSQALVDPFCGSGTLVIEGALMAARRPPNLERRFPFESWPHVDMGRLARVRDALSAGADGDGTPGDRSGSAPLLGSDRDAGAVAASRENARAAGVDRMTRFTRAVVSEAPFPAEPGLLVTNPPYGHRVGDAPSLRNLYARLGARLRDEWSGGRVALLSADRDLSRQLGLPLRTVFRTSNGGIPVEGVVADVP